MQISHPQYLTPGDIDFPISLRNFSKVIDLTSYDKFVSEAQEKHLKALIYVVFNASCRGLAQSIIPPPALGLQYHESDF